MSSIQKKQSKFSISKEFKKMEEYYKGLLNTNIIYPINIKTRIDSIICTIDLFYNLNTINEFMINIIYQSIKSSNIINYDFKELDKNIFKYIAADVLNPNCSLQYKQIKIQLLKYERRTYSYTKRNLN